MLPLSNGRRRSSHLRLGPSAVRSSKGWRDSGPGRGDDPPAVVTAVEDQNWLSVALAEYSAVRAEVIQALQAQHAIVSYGASVIAVVTAVGIGTADDKTSAAGHLFTFMFLVLIPVLIVVIYMVWGSEVLRMQRAGTYLFVLERVLNGRFPGADPLNWEHVVNPPPRKEGNGRKRGMTNQRSMPHVDRLQRLAIPVALLAMVVGSVAAGLLMGDMHWMVLLTGVAVAAGIVGFLWLESERRLLRRLYAHVCQLQQESQARQQPLSMQIWIDSLTAWPSIAERVPILRRRVDQPDKGGPGGSPDTGKPL